MSPPSRGAQPTSTAHLKRHLKCAQGTGPVRRTAPSTTRHRARPPRNARAGVHRTCPPRPVVHAPAGPTRCAGATNDERWGVGTRTRYRSSTLPPYGPASPPPPPHTGVRSHEGADGPSNTSPARCPGQPEFHREHLEWAVDEGLQAHDTLDDRRGGCSQQHPGTLQPPPGQCRGESRDGD